jgi:CRISPR-associated protein Csx10
MRIRLTIIARSPLALSKRKPGGQFRESYDYIPGSVIRGAMAGAMLDSGQGDSALFAKLFLADRPAIFTNAYPQAREEAFRETRVIPITAMSCKDPEGRGFATENKKKEHHGVFDTLIDRVCCELLRPAALVYSPNCPECGGLVDRLDGFYAESYSQYRQPQVRQRLLTRVALSRRRGVAEDELLYSPMVIAEATRKRENERTEYHDSVFVADVWADLAEEESEQLTEILKGIDRLGGGGSRGLGAVTIEPKITLRGSDDVEARVAAFNAAMKGRWALYERLAPQREPEVNPRQGVFFTINLEADAILKTSDWQPTMVFDEGALRAATGMEAKLVRSFAFYDYRGGWNTAWGLPKDTEVVTKMGSVYLFWAQGLDYAALAKLEREGIGEACAAGFGRVRICDEFHTIFREEAK